MRKDETTIRGHYPAKSRQISRWKNGGGAASQIMWRTSPEGQDYKWRLSTADVEQNGPFSIFPGKHRLLKVVSGGPLELMFEHTHQSLTKADPAFSFSGDVACYADVLGEKVVNLNLMYTPECSVRMQTVILSEHPPAQSTHVQLVFLISAHNGFAAHDVFDLTQIEPDVYAELIGASVVLIEIDE